MKHGLQIRWLLRKTDVTVQQREIAGDVNSRDRYVHYLVNVIYTSFETIVCERCTNLNYVYPQKQNVWLIS